MKSLIAIVVLGAALGGVGAVAQDDTSDPTVPPWVGEDGIVDPSKAPNEVHVVGADGERIVDENGEPVTVNLRSLLREMPGEPPSEPTASSSDDDPLPLDVDAEAGDKSQEEVDAEPFGESDDFKKHRN